jgi:hypothetical protein
MIILSIGWLSKKIKKRKADIREAPYRLSSQEDADGQAGGWLRIIAPACAPKRQESNGV